MFDILLTCKPEELLQYTKMLSAQVETAEDAEKLIRVLWRRVPELTEQQEKELHQVGRALRKKFHMKPVKI